MGPINLIKMHSLLTEAHLFTWALLVAAIFILEDRGQVGKRFGRGPDCRGREKGLRRDGALSNDMLERL